MNFDIEAKDTENIGLKEEVNRKLGEYKESSDAGFENEYFTVQGSDKKTEDELAGELEKYSQEASQRIEDQRFEKYSRRKSADNIFRDLMVGTLIIGVIVCFILVIL